MCLLMDSSKVSADIFVKKSEIPPPPQKKAFGVIQDLKAPRRLENHVIEFPYYEWFGKKNF